MHGPPEGRAYSTRRHIPKSALFSKYGRFLRQRIKKSPVKLWLFYKIYRANNPMTRLFEAWCSTRIVTQSRTSIGAEHKTSVMLSNDLLFFFLIAALVLWVRFLRGPEQKSAAYRRKWRFLITDFSRPTLMLLPLPRGRFHRRVAEVCIKGPLADLRQSLRDEMDGTCRTDKLIRSHGAAEVHRPVGNGIIEEQHPCLDLCGHALTLTLTVAYKLRKYLIMRAWRRGESNPCP